MLLKEKNNEYILKFMQNVWENISKRIFIFLLIDVSDLIYMSSYL